MAVDLQDLARRMLADHDARTPNQVFAEPVELTTEQAYFLQAEVTLLRVQREEKVIGYKVGCTSQMVQKQLAINEPIFARVFDTGRFESGAELSCSRFANLAVEGELAVRLGQDVSAPVGVGECRAAIASVFPVIELHHYVLRSPQPSPAELVASGGMHAGLVLPDREACLSDLESLSVWIDDERIGKVSGADVTELAVRSVSWLADRLAEQGLTLARGQVVLTGSLLPLYTVKPDMRVVAALTPLGRSSAMIVP
jgi:2-keto-4-pentenoate hydratase